MPNPPKMSVYEFGEQLIATNDLDPIYVMLEQCDLPQPKLHRWLLAYWCFYHSGTASWIVDHESYWYRMRQAAASSDWPRCRERRHFRGENARKSVEWLHDEGVPTLFQPLVGFDLKLEEVMRYVQTWVGFGPWIAFKVADMLERLDLASIEFSTGPIFLFKSPRKGAEEMWVRYGEYDEYGDYANYKASFGGDRPASVGEWAVESLLEALGGRLAPPRYERGLGAAEAETVLCKWLSYLSGHYRIGEDIEGLHKALADYPNNTSRHLLEAGSDGGLW